MYTPSFSAGFGEDPPVAVHTRAQQENRDDAPRRTARHSYRRRPGDDQLAASSSYGLHKGRASSWYVKIPIPRLLNCVCMRSLSISDSSHVGAVLSLRACENALGRRSLVRVALGSLNAVSLRAGRGIRLTTPCSLQQGELHSTARAAASPPRRCRSPRTAASTSTRGRGDSCTSSGKIQFCGTQARGGRGGHGRGM